MPLEVNPYTNVSRSSRFLRIDSQKGKENVSSCITSKAFAAKEGKMKQVCWRPPIQYQTTVSGSTAVHADSRGQFLKFRHAKLIFKNQLDVPITVHVNTPVGTIANPESIATRVKHSQIVLDPCGTKKIKTRGQGRKKKEYSVSTDVHVHLFSSRDIDENDTNYKTVLKRKVANTVGTAYSYYSWVIGEYCVVINDINKNTGAAYGADLDAVEVEMKVKYEVSALEGGLNVSDTIKVGAFIVGTGDAKLMFQFDTSFVPPSVLDAASLDQPKIMQLPEEGHNELGIKFVDKGNWNYRADLYWFAGGVPTSPVMARQYQNPNIRFVVPGLDTFKWSNQNGKSSGWNGAEFGYSAVDNVWCLMSPLGQMNYLIGAQNNYMPVPASARTPIIGFSVLRDTSLDERMEKITLDQVIEAVSLVLKVLTFIATVI